MREECSTFKENSLAPRNPKRTGNEHPIHINWFPYYAGYSSNFVHDVLLSLNIQNGDIILDPWNGSGTTTTTAHRIGAKVLGCDINPVMVVAAKSALLDPGAAPSLVPLAEDILHTAATLPPSEPNDPLLTWYTPSSAATLRRIHGAIWKVLVDFHATPSYQAHEISRLSTLAAFFLTALMRTTRHFLAPFIGSNPTWIRSPANHANRLRPTDEVLFKYFRKEVRRMAASLDMASINGLQEQARLCVPVVAVANSTSLPFTSGSVNAVISSPPYLTRIDYAVATKPELAILGMSLSAEFDALRHLMIGAPTVRRNSSKLNPISNSCLLFLDSVANHPSKGSYNYYHKIFVQYFTDMAASLTEIARVLAKKATCVLVVQDSYYKELHADLALFVTEIAQSCGLVLFDRHDFKWNRNMARINSRARKYRESAIAVESALWFRKR